MYESRCLIKPGWGGTWRIWFISYLWRNLTQSWCPYISAILAGLSPQQSSSSIGARRECSSRSTASRPDSAAKCAGVHPCSVFKHGLAPCSMRTRTVSACPVEHAAPCDCHMHLSQERETGKGLIQVKGKSVTWFSRNSHLSFVGARRISANSSNLCNSSKIKGLGIKSVSIIFVTLILSFLLLNAPPT